MDYKQYAIIYLIAINIISFVMFYADKRKAKNDKWRIKENTLHLFSFVGGAAGSVLAMITFHHKTQKTKFCVITTVAFMLNIYVIAKILIY